MAEVEQASLMSEPLSDKSSSPALPDDLSLDEHSSYQLLVRHEQVRSGHVFALRRQGEGWLRAVSCFHLARFIPASVFDPVYNQHQWLDNVEL